MLSLRCQCGSGIRANPLPEDHFVLSACRSCLAPVMFRIDLPAEPQPLPTGEWLNPSRLPEDSVIARALPLVNESVDALPVLPEVAQRILAAIHDPLAEMREIARLLGEDAVLGSRVIQLANSAAYGPTRIASLLDACTRLGMKRIAQVIHMTAQADIYRTLGPKYRHVVERLWRHGIATAHCIETIATRARLHVDYAPFLTGLIHDIGKLVLADAIVNRYSGQIGRLADEPDLLMHAVAEYHPLAGLHAVQKWGLATDVCVAVYFQSHPLSAPAGHGQQLALAVQLADAMATRAGFSVVDSDKVDLESLPGIAAFELDVDALTAHCEQLPDMLEPVFEAFALV